jgi:hypothetical protein
MDFITTTGFFQVIALEYLFHQTRVA